MLRRIHLILDLGFRIRLIRNLSDLVPKRSLSAKFSRSRPVERVGGDEFRN